MTITLPKRQYAANITFLSNGPHNWIRRIGAENEAIITSFFCTYTSNPITGPVRCGAFNYAGIILPQ